MCAGFTTCMLANAGDWVDSDNVHQTTQLLVCVHVSVCMCVANHCQHMRDQFLSSCSVFRSESSGVIGVERRYEWLPVIRWQTKECVCERVYLRREKQETKMDCMTEGKQSGSYHDEWKHRQETETRTTRCYEGTTAKPPWNAALTWEES